MTPKFLTETRSFFETEMAFWQSQATTLGTQSVAQTEAVLKEVRERAQVAVDTHSNLAVSLWKHNVDALERGYKLFTAGFTAPA